MSVDGILNVSKPPGKTSFQLVSLIRRMSHQRRVGHAGTLDPDASGVLPICIGQATRVVEFMSDAPKVYRAKIELGITTDTCDASGKVISRGDPSSITQVQVDRVINTFRGVIQQVPPMYSAIKHKGKPLYELARAGIDVPRAARERRILRLEVIEWQLPLFTIEVECSAGTYIRSLAHDIGNTLGCGAHLNNLVRLRCGSFDLSNAVSLTNLEEAFNNGTWMHLLHPIDQALLAWKAVIVDKATEALIRNGQRFPQRCDNTTSQKLGHCRAYTSDGYFLAVLKWQEQEGLWHPSKVFHNTFIFPPSMPMSENAMTTSGNPF
ncbi:MAG: tRNA pseudouridine(55) synthase TruB [Chloroflexota bacterium]|nr:tRNA pseudouridine(55) synthase TruB [Chloroflexota bacterium]